MWKFPLLISLQKKYQGATAAEVRWYNFKLQSGSRCIDQMLTTPGAWYQVIRIAHLQASFEGKFMPKLYDWKLKMRILKIWNILK